jgi:hypothetical protein
MVIALALVGGVVLGLGTGKLWRKYVEPKIAVEKAVGKAVVTDIKKGL